MKNTLPPGEESLLKKHGFSAARREFNIPLTDIDWERSAKNQARLKAPLIPDHVEDMTMAVRGGEVLPDLILCDDGSKKYHIWSGNNRAAAYRAAGKNIDSAVIVETNDAEMLDMMPRVFNRTGGVKLERDESLAHAVYAINTYNWTQARAADTFGISEHSISKYVRCLAVREQLESMKVSTKNLTNAHIIALAPLSSNDHVLEKAARIATDAKINAGHLKDVVREIKNARNAAGKTESAQLDCAKKLHDELVGATPAKTASGKRSKATVLRMMVAGLRKTLEKVSSVKQLEITDRHEIEKANAMLEELGAECYRVASGKARRRKAAS